MVNFNTFVFLVDPRSAKDVARALTEAFASPWERVAQRRSGGAREWRSRPLGLWFYFREADAVEEGPSFRIVGGTPSPHHQPGAQEVSLDEHISRLLRARGWSTVMTLTEHAPRRLWAITEKFAFEPSKLVETTVAPVSFHLHLVLRSKTSLRRLGDSIGGALACRFETDSSGALRAHVLGLSLVLKSAPAPGAYELVGASTLPGADGEVASLNEHVALVLREAGIAVTGAKSS